MSNETLFQVLARQPWWVSLIVAAILFGLTQLVLPEIAPFVAAPFVGVAAWIAWRQWRGAAPVNIDERLAQLRAMPWENFSLVVSEAYRRQGYAVEESADGAFDFTLRKNGRITLVQCRRWKVNQVGAGPLRELHEAVGRLDAMSGICITAGAYSPNALAFAEGKPLTLVSGAALAELAGVIEKKKKRWLLPF